MLGRKEPCVLLQSRYRPQCELYRQILRNKLLPDCKLQPYPYFKPRKEGH